MWYSSDVILCVQVGEVEDILLAQQVSLEVITNLCYDHHGKLVILRVWCVYLLCRGVHA